MQKVLNFAPEEIFKLKHWCVHINVDCHKTHQNSQFDLFLLP